VIMAMRTYIIFLSLDRFYCLSDSMFLQVMHNARYLRDLDNVNHAVIARTVMERVLTSGMMALL
jgi:hypothetical protein